MHEKRIAKMVNDLFHDIVETDEVREQKEELRIHVAERVQDYMAQGMEFEKALAHAKAGLGDPEELVSGFERKRVVEWDEVDEDYSVRFNFRFKRIFARLTPLAPFIYILLGITQGTWREWAWMPAVPNWWLWGWVIIPVIPILSSGFSWNKLVAVAPFVYIVIGFFTAGWQWWAFGWMIIPMTAILFGGMGGSKKRKKKRKKWKITLDEDINFGGEGMRDFVHEMVNIGQIADEVDIAVREARREVEEAAQEIRRDVDEAVQEIRDEFDGDDRRN